MSEAMQNFVFKSAVDPKLVAEIEILNGVPKGYDWSKWYRTAAFFGIFIVFAGILGGLKLSDQKLLVGFMVGGYLAMYVDGHLTAVRTFGKNKSAFRPVLSGERGVGNGGVWMTTSRARTEYFWNSVAELTSLSHGILIRTVFATAIPIAFSELPLGVEPAEFEAQLRRRFDDSKRGAKV